MWWWRQQLEQCPAASNDHGNATDWNGSAASYCQSVSVVDKGREA